MQPNKYMKILIKDVMIALLITTLIAAFVISVLYGFDKGEESKCMKLKQQSVDYPEFHLSQFEAAMCKYQGIVINAPVQ